MVSFPIQRYDPGMRVLLITIVLFAVAGCGPRIHTESYDVWVRNDTSDPLTIGLVKGGPPFEVQWASPQVMATRVDVDENWLWGQTIPAGRTAETRVKGRFYSGDQAWLRAYRGEDRSLDDLLTVARQSGDRLDMRLRPGRNDIIITDERHHLRGTRIQSGPQQ
jgi:hypothetical protein